jgi:DNA-binding MarR family transcriptional regulator
MALAAHPTERGWAVPMGVRDIAAGVAVTKDTVARAVSRLTRAGLVTRTHVEVLGAGRRSGYLLILPDSLRVIESLATSRGLSRDRPAVPSFITSDAIATPPLGGNDDD